MAMNLSSARRAKRTRRAPMAEINVTPLVDVMLVLLIIFMISAPLLTVGVPLELPKTDASAVEADDEPITVSVDRAGATFVGEDAVPFDDLARVTTAMAGREIEERPIFVRADGQAPYEAVARVMARLSAVGFKRINLITDTTPNAPAATVGASAEG
ncbi:MAG: ExbD/TolR family protein [Brevundimonas sp.]